MTTRHLEIFQIEPGNGCYPWEEGKWYIHDHQTGVNASQLFDSEEEAEEALLDADFPLDFDNRYDIEG